MAFIDMGKDVDIYFSENNAGGEIPILFCHGSGGRSSHWRFQKRLSEKMRTIAVDLPGHGRSGGTAEDNVSAYREVLKTLVARKNLEPLFLAGHSLGGAIALDYARLYPGDLRGIILIATGARLRVMPAILERFRKKEVFPEMLSYIYSENAAPSLLEEARREMRETSPEIFYADFSACDGFDLMDRLHSIEVPALILVGREDLLTPVKYSKFLKDNLPDAELQVFEDAGHMIMLEQPRKINKYIRDFVLRQWGGAD
ncbi:MAG: alpha/beta hydrolase [Firmicutes bacterium]|jgi:pimeloyl-ACP methyl ester carboxylesterase|nr:alpha/beta hydrolase [Bacillota bacterium]